MGILHYKVHSIPVIGILTVFTLFSSQTLNAKYYIKHGDREPLIETTEPEKVPGTINGKEILSPEGKIPEKDMDGSPTPERILPEQRQPSRIPQGRIPANRIPSQPLQPQGIPKQELPRQGLERNQLKSNRLESKALPKNRLPRNELKSNKLERNRLQKNPLPR